MSKRSRVAAACALLLTAACAPAVPALQAPSASAEPPPRRPDAVVVEPPPAMPVPAVHAEAQGVVALREPLSSDAVVDVVRALLDAWQRESLDALGALLTPDAGPIDSRARGRAALVESWRQRMRA
ncbi:MAG TPA: nuclear transport factor 2 family protein, partial [Polyangiaceae bacterium]